MLLGICKSRRFQRDTCYKCFYIAMLHMLEALEVIIGIHPCISFFLMKFTQLWFLLMNVNMCSNNLKLIRKSINEEF